MEVDFTSKIESFIAHDGPKFSYGKKPLGKELFFQSTALLFEQGINDVAVKVVDWEDTKCFFGVTHEKSALPFDIFAASFYLLSRYEEYLPHVKDGLGRYSATESIAYIHDFLKDPVVDIWALKFKNKIQERFPEIGFQKKQFSIQPVVYVSSALAYNKIGLLQSSIGILKDLIYLRFHQIKYRFNVLVGLKKDPFDTFDFFIRLQKSKKRKLIVFFGVGDYSSYEININHNNELYRRMIKHVADYIEVGLRVSYEGVCDFLKLKKEKQRIEQIVNRQSQYSLCTFFKIKLPEAYRNFVELEIKRDFSMGYAEYSGFRAGTCTPFLFYDLDYEVQTPLMVYPTSFTSLSLLKEGRDKESVLKNIIYYLDKIKKVQGICVPVFLNEMLGELNEQKYWKTIFEHLWNIDESRELK
ncbi:polysaccharide deacetylase family protein [Aquimarina hainanensis]|uniref:Polysaccharide deacetylase family protein n=2 Tax=Aquimarina TaxID=290174 RepID=A0ABW5N917_9FLAO